MEMFTTILAYGYIFIVGFVFLIMLFQILAFYIAGRVTGSIDDELISAFTLFGTLLIIGMASTLVNAVLTTFLTGMLIPAIIAFVLYLIIIIYAVEKIYELSIGKAILHLIISFIITVALTGLTVYVGTLVMPEIDLGDVMEMDMEFEIDTEPLDETEEVMEEAEVEETMEEEEPETDGEETVEETTPSTPSLPGDTE